MIHVQYMYINSENVALSSSTLVTCIEIETTSWHHTYDVPSVGDKQEFILKLSQKPNKNWTKTILKQSSCNSVYLSYVSFTNQAVSTEFTARVLVNLKLVNYVQMDKISPKCPLLRGSTVYINYIRLWILDTMYTMPIHYYKHYGIQSLFYCKFNCMYM